MFKSNAEIESRHTGERRGEGSITALPGGQEVGFTLKWLQRGGGDVTQAVPAGTATRDLRGDGWHVRLDLSPQVLSLSIPRETTSQQGEEVLSPTCALRHARTFVSASMLAFKAKLFDDGLYAAAEMAAQPAKTHLLAALAHAAPAVGAAARLGGADVALSEEAQRLTADFLADEFASKPLGFYTGSDTLRRIFQQDRFLQRALSPTDARCVRSALESAPALLATYGDWLDTASKLTNPSPPGMRDLRQPDGTFFFPPSRSHESDLVMRLYGDKPIPEGFSLADEVVRRLHDGSLRFEPSETSGWYDVQSWALEALVLLDNMPEATRLRTDDRYRGQLQDLFKAVLSLTRETHAKQLHHPRCGAAFHGETEPIAHVFPQLTVEPLPTYYERRAQGYRFVGEVLRRLSPLSAMRRVTPAGPSKQSLEEELSEVIRIFQGAAAVARHELGMAAATGPDVDTFQEWMKKPDVADDVRMMVPVFYDIGRRKTKVWAILGWATRSLFASFAVPPTVRFVKGRVRTVFGPCYQQLAYPVFAEAYVTRLLDRGEFRAMCDHHKTRGEILRHLV